MAVFDMGRKLRQDGIFPVLQWQRARILEDVPAFEEDCVQLILYKKQIFFTGVHFRFHAVREKL